VGEVVDSEPSVRPVLSDADGTEDVDAVDADVSVAALSDVMS
jgi:hypothetical protein